jgi:hypothetical protein
MLRLVGGVLSGCSPDDEVERNNATSEAGRNIPQEA